MAAQTYRYSYVKRGKAQALRNAALTDTESDTSSEEDEEIKQEPQKLQTSNCNNQMLGHWYWQGNDGDYVQYDLSVSKKLNDLKINDSYKCCLNGKEYEIKRTGVDDAIQTNLQNGMYRKAIRKPKTKENELKYIWFSSFADGTQHDFSYNVSLQLNKLSVNGTYATTINDVQYRFTKTAEDICEQRNMATHKCQSVFRQNASSKQKFPKQITENEMKTHKVEWCRVTEQGTFVPFNDLISSQLESLEIGKCIKINLTRSDGMRQYEITKILKDICQQRDTKTNEKWEVRRK